MTIPVRLLGKGFWILPLILALFGGACSILEPETTRIRVVNESFFPVAFLALELETSYLFDPAPTFQVEATDGRVLPPGASRFLPRSEIEGNFRAGDDLRFFLYQVVRDTAEFRMMITLTADQLAASNHRVIFSGF